MTVKIQTNVTPKLDGDEMSDKEIKESPKMMTTKECNIQRSNVRVCHNLGDKRKVVQNHITNPCFSKMTRAVQIWAFADGRTASYMGTKHLVKTRLQ